MKREVGMLVGVRESTHLSDPFIVPSPLTQVYRGTTCLNSEASASVLHSQRDLPWLPQPGVGSPARPASTLWDPRELLGFTEPWFPLL